MLIREENLVTLNAKNKVQLITIRLSNNPINNTYQINRTTGQFGGKTIFQPAITIATGKVKRTIGEQAALQYNSMVQSYLDKGYIKLSSLTDARIELLSEGSIKTLLNGNILADQYTIPRPMLAKSADQCSSDIWNKQLAVSTKIDGVRMLMYYQNGIVKTASRGSKDYNAATKHLREDPIILALFQANPKLVLDGELYKHGVDWPLQRISGLARVKEWEPECENLEYWIYDFIDSKPFKERLEVLKAMKELFPKDSKIKVIDHYIMSGYANIKKAHDKFVSDGFEGLCARTLDREYGINKRSALYLIKLKNYKDAEFKVVGIKEGLRPEDMCFTLVTNEGKEFAAKPIGTNADRISYLQNKDNYIGKMATCKYFYLSKDGVPLQPILLHFRPEDE